MRKLLYTLFFGLVLTGCAGKKKPGDTAYVSPAPDFNADSAYRYVADQCAFGPRVMNSAAHDSCGDYIARQFLRMGMKVTSQYADANLYDGTPVRMRNIIASYRPEAPARILISGHWDSRRWADNDPDTLNHRTPIDGANDGASSVGVMIELARQLQAAPDTLRPSIGVDFICWDAEDNGQSGAGDDDSWCLGSHYWASSPAAPIRMAHDGERVGSRPDGENGSPVGSPRYGVNLDMVGGHNSVFYREAFSMAYAPKVVDKVWGAAHRIGYGNYFSYDPRGGAVTDDHLQVTRGGVPCIDIIASDTRSGGFPSTWHTLADNIKNISKETLKAVGQTMLEVIWTE